MADFGWFQAQERKQGKVLCMLCFESKMKEEMEPVTDSPGVVWDVCKQCAEIEKEYGQRF